MVFVEVGGVRLSSEARPVGVKVFKERSRGRLGLDGWYRCYSNYKQ